MITNKKSANDFYGSPDDLYDELGPETPSLGEEIRSKWRYEVSPWLNQNPFGTQGVPSQLYKGAVSSVLPFINPEAGEPTTMAEKTALIGGGALGFAPWFAASKILKGAKAVQTAAAAAKEFGYLTKGLTVAERLKEVVVGAKEAAIIGSIHSMMQDTGLDVGSKEDTAARLSKGLQGGMNMMLLHNAGVITNAGASKILGGIAPKLEMFPSHKRLVQGFLSQGALGAGMGAAEAEPGQRVQGALASAAGFAIGNLPFDVMGTRGGRIAERSPDYLKYQEALRSAKPGMTPEEQKAWGAGFKVSAPFSTSEAKPSPARHYERDDAGNLRFAKEATANKGSTQEEIKAGVQAAIDANSAKGKETSGRKQLDTLDATFEATISEQLKSGKMSPREAKNARDMFVKVNDEAKREMIEQTQDFKKLSIDLLDGHALGMNREAVGSLELIFSLNPRENRLDNAPFSNNIDLQTMIREGRMKDATKQVVKIAKENKIPLKIDEDAYKVYSADIKPGRSAESEQIRSTLLKMKRTSRQVKEALKKAELAKIVEKAKEEEPGLYATEAIAIAQARLAELEKWGTTNENGETPHIKQVGKNAWAVVSKDSPPSFTSETKADVLKKIRESKESIKSQITQMKSFETREKNKEIAFMDAEIKPVQTIRMEEREQARTNIFESIEVLRNSPLNNQVFTVSANEAGIFGVPILKEHGSALGGYISKADAAKTAIDNESGATGVFYEYTPDTFIPAVNKGSATWNTEVYKYDVGTNPKDFAGVAIDPDAKILGSTRASNLSEHIKKIFITPEADPRMLQGALNIIVRRMNQVADGKPVKLIEIEMVTPRDADRMSLEMDNASTETISKYVELKAALKESMKTTPFRESTGKIAREAFKFNQYLVFWTKVHQNIMSGKRMTVGELIDEVIGGKGPLAGLDQTPEQRKAQDDMIANYAKKEGISLSSARFALRKDVGKTLEFWKEGFKGVIESEQYNLLKPGVTTDTEVSAAIFMRAPTIPIISQKLNDAVKGIAKWNQDRGIKQFKAGGKDKLKDFKSLDNFTDEIVRQSKFLKTFDADYYWAAINKKIPEGTAMMMSRLAASESSDSKALLKHFEEIVSKGATFRQLTALTKGAKKAGAIAENFTEVLDAFKKHQTTVEDVGRDISRETFLESTQFILDRVNNLRKKIEGIKAPEMKDFGEIEMWLIDEINGITHQVKDTEIGKFLKSKLGKVIKNKDGVIGYEGRRKRGGGIVFIPLDGIERSMRKYDNIKNKFQGDIELLFRTLDSVRGFNEAAKSNKSFDMYKMELFKNLAADRSKAGLIPDADVIKLMGEGAPGARETLGVMREPTPAQSSASKTVVDEPTMTGEANYPLGTYEPGEKRYWESTQGTGTGAGDRPVGDYESYAAERAKKIRSTQHNPNEWSFRVGDFNEGGAAGLGFTYKNKVYVITNEEGFNNGGYKFAPGSHIIIEGGKYNESTGMTMLDIKGDGTIEEGAFNTVSQFFKEVPKDSIVDLPVFEGFKLIPFFKSVMPHLNPLTEQEKAAANTKDWNRDPVGVLVHMLEIGKINRNDMKIRATDSATAIKEAYAKLPRRVLDIMNAKGDKPAILEEVFIQDPNSRTVTFTDAYNKKVRDGLETMWDNATSAEREFIIDFIIMNKCIGVRQISEGNMLVNIFDKESAEGAYFHKVYKNKDGNIISRITKEGISAQFEMKKKPGVDEAEMKAKGLTLVTDPASLTFEYLTEYANTLAKSTALDGVSRYLFDGKEALIWVGGGYRQAATLKRLGFSSMNELREVYEENRGVSRASPGGGETAYTLKSTNLKPFIEGYLYPEKGDATLKGPLKTYKSTKGLVKKYSFSLGLFPFLGAYDMAVGSMGYIKGLFKGFRAPTELRMRDASRYDLQVDDMSSYRAFLDDLLTYSANPESGKFLSFIHNRFATKGKITTFMFKHFNNAKVNAWEAETANYMRKNPGVSESDAKRVAARVINERARTLTPETFNGFWGGVSQLFFAARNEQVGALRHVAGIFAPAARKLIKPTAMYPGSQMMAFRGMSEAELKYTARALLWTHSQQLLGFLVASSLTAVLSGSSFPWERKNPNDWLKIGTGMKDQSGREIMLTPGIFKNIRDMLEIVPPIGGFSSYSRNKMDMTLRFAAESIFGEEFIGGMTRKLTPDKYGEYAVRKVMGTFPALRLGASIAAPEMMQNVMDLYPKSMGEHLLDFTGMRTSRGFGGVGATAQNKAYLIKQLNKKYMEADAELTQQMDIAWENKDYGKLKELAKQLYATDEGLQNYIYRKQHPIESAIKGIPKRRKKEYMEALRNA